MGMFVRHLLAGIVCSGLLAWQAQAAELVMFDSPACEYCEQWDAEISAIYPLTAEGRRLPLRRVSAHEDLPADLAAIGAVIYTPTFVLVEDGRELGRISGYPGEDFFWAYLETLVAKLPPAPAACDVLETSNSNQTGKVKTC